MSPTEGDCYVAIVARLYDNDLTVWVQGNSCLTEATRCCKQPWLIGSLCGLTGVSECEWDDVDQKQKGFSSGVD